MKRVIIALLFAMIGGVSALAQDLPDAYKIFTGVDSGNCNEIDMITVGSGIGPDHYYETLVKAGGKIYMDEVIEGTGTSSPGIWGLYSANDRFMQTAEFPLPKNTPITAEHTVSHEDHSPEWRTVATFSKCNKPKLSKIVNFRAFALHRNGSFEAFADIGDNAIPTAWEPDTAFLDSLSGVSCAAVEAPVGSCVLQIIPNGSTQKLSQFFTLESPMGGKYIELAAFQLVQGESNVKGNIKATLKFANGSKTILKLTAKKHSSSEGYKYAVVRTKMPAKLVSVKLVITEKGGGSGVWRIDGLSLAVYKKSTYTYSEPPLRAPLPDAG